MVAMTKVSEPAAVGLSEAAPAATPAEAKAVPAEPRTADPASADAKAQPAAHNREGSSQSSAQVGVGITKVLSDDDWGLP